MSAAAPAEAPARFPIRFSGANHGLALLGLSPEGSWVDVRDDTMEVRMGWAFQLAAPRSSVARVAADSGLVVHRGVYGGWRGRWLVNGSADGLVRIDFDPPVRAHVGPLPVTVRELRVSAVDPDALIAALEPGVRE